MHRSLNNLHVPVLLLVFCLCTTSLAQIHFSTGWEPGKRSMEEPERPSKLACYDQLDMPLLMDIIRLVKRQADKLSYCMKSCPPLGRNI